MPPRHRSRPHDPLTRIRNEMDALGRPGMAGSMRAGFAGALRGGSQGVLENVPPDPGIGSSDSAHLLCMSATGASIASGGGHVTFDTSVAQHGFDGVVSASGGHWIHPANGDYLLVYTHEWATYDGGGTFRLEIDGVLVPEGVLLDGIEGRRGAAVLPYRAQAGSVARIVGSTSSVSAETYDARARIVLVQETAQQGGGTRLFTADAWGIVRDGMDWWTTEGNSGVTVSQRAAGGTETASFESTALGTRVRGITTDGADLWMVGDADGTVARYSTAGVLLSSFDFSTDWSDQGSEGVGFDGSDLWVTGSGSNEVHRFSTAGAHLQSFSLPFSPRGIACHAGRLYIVDITASVVRVVQASDGADLGSIDVSGMVTSPTGVWIDPDGILYVAKAGDGVYRTGTVLASGVGGSDAASGLWLPLVGDVGDVPAGLEGLVVVEAGSQGSAIDGSGGITVTWRWGIDAADIPYFESTGVTAGEQAVLALDPTDGTYQLVAVTA